MAARPGGREHAVVTAEEVPRRRVRPGREGPRLPQRPPGLYFGTSGVAWFLARRLHGVTGDVLGATVETAELTALLTVSAWTYARP